MKSKAGYFASTCDALVLSPHDARAPGEAVFDGDLKLYEEKSKVMMSISNALELIFSIKQ